jgi:recombination protein RecA
LNKELDKAMKQIKKSYGEDALFSGADREKLEIKWISTGVLDIDLATQPNTGGGGIPIGRIIEIYGPEGSGKTTLVLSIIAQAQKDGHKCAFFDAENSYNPDFADLFGVKTEDLIMSQKSEGESVLDVIEALAKTGEVRLIAIDSVAALSAAAILTSSMEDQQMAVDARMWSKAMKKLKAVLNKNKCTLILINQLREKVGQLYGDPSITPGGRAIKFYSDQRIEVKKRDTFSEGSGDTLVVHGHRLRARIIKNKVGTVGRQGFVDLYYDKGFNLNKDILAAGEKTGVIQKAGGWRTYTPLGVEEGSERELKENGMDNFVQAIYSLDNPDLMLKEIKERILLGREEPLYYAEDDAEINTEGDVEEDEQTGAEKEKVPA